MNKGRLFTFGCSYTQWRWPTWADILGQEFEEYQNWGREGGGNQFIFHSLVEANQRNKFSPDDTVIIMWSTPDREDRYLRGSWYTYGPVYGSAWHNQNWVKKFADDRWYAIRDLTCMAAVKELLDKWGVKYHFLSMVAPNVSLNMAVEPVKDVAEMFNEVIKEIKPGIVETIFNFDFHCRFSDEEYAFYAGSEWPSHKEFMQGYNGSKPEIIKEVTKFRNHYLAPLDYQNPDPTKRDTHPRPVDHLEYLEKMLPEFSISNTTKSWVKECQSKVARKEEEFPELKKYLPTRF